MSKLALQYLGTAYSIDPVGSHDNCWVSTGVTQTTWTLLMNSGYHRDGLGHQCHHMMVLIYL